MQVLMVLQYYSDPLLLLLILL